MAAKTYYLGTGAPGGEYTGDTGANFTYLLLTSTVGEQAPFTVAIAAETTEVDIVVTPQNEPGAADQYVDGVWIVEVYCSSGDSEIYLQVFVERINEAGTVVVDGPHSLGAEQGPLANNTVFTFSNAVNWTSSGAASDRIRYRYNFRNNHGSQTRSVDLNWGTADTEHKTTQVSSSSSSKSSLTSSSSKSSSSKSSSSKSSSSKSSLSSSSKSSKSSRSSLSSSSKSSYSSSSKSSLSSSSTSSLSSSSKSSLSSSSTSSLSSSSKSSLSSSSKSSLSSSSKSSLSSSSKSSLSSSSKSSLSSSSKSSLSSSSKSSLSSSSKSSSSKSSSSKSSSSKSSSSKSSISSSSSTVPPVVIRDVGPSRIPTEGLSYINYQHFYMRKYGFATDVYFPLYRAGTTKIDDGSFNFVSGDTKTCKNGGAFVDTANLPIYHGEGVYKISLTTGEMTGTDIVLTIVDQSNPKAWADRVVLIETYSDEAANHVFDVDDDEAALANILSDLDGITDKISALATQVETLKTSTSENAAAARKKLTEIREDAANIQSSIDTLEIGIVPTLVDHNYGGTDSLAVRNVSGGVKDVMVKIYRKSDYLSGKRSAADVIGETITNAEGRWLQPISLFPGDYTAEFSRSKEFHFGAYYGKIFVKHFVV